MSRKKSEANILMNIIIKVHNNSFDLLGREMVKNFSVNLVHMGLPPLLHGLPPQKNHEEKKTKNGDFSQETFFFVKTVVCK